MKAAGCIVVGKTNTPEFGLGSHTFNEVFGVTRNAFDRSRSAGGSSGGAAVALATHMLPVADGSDFMGSLRNPAAWNDVYGFRPSQGRVPRWPAADVWVALMSTEGPMGRTVKRRRRAARRPGGLGRAGAAFDREQGVVRRAHRRLRSARRAHRLARRPRRLPGDGKRHRRRSASARSRGSARSAARSSRPRSASIPERLWQTLARLAPLERRGADRAASSPTPTTAPASSPRRSGNTTRDKGSPECRQSRRAPSGRRFTATC